jgi:hypothetical protein
LDMCHTLKGGVHRRDMEREGNQKLECGWCTHCIGVAERKVRRETDRPVFW